MIVWWNGSLCPLEQVHLSPMDHGFLVGDGVFETLAAHRGQPFAVTRHWRRLVRSCAALGLEAPDLTTVRDAFAQVLAANQLIEARLRLTLTSGCGPPGTERGTHTTQNLLITGTPLSPWPATEHVMLCPWPRLSSGALTGVKSTSYAENVRALAWARHHGAGEALFVNERGEVCEGTGSNIFWLRHDRLETPPLSSGCLPGTTRELVLELATRLSLPCQEVALPVAEWLAPEVTEVFLTSSTRDVHPVRAVGDRALPAPGPVTSQLQTAFADWQNQDSDP